MMKTPRFSILLLDRKALRAGFAAGFAVAYLTACSPKPPTSQSPMPPAAGAVADEKAAIAIAVATLIPGDGAKQIADWEPFRAELNDGVWHVYSAPAPTRKIDGVEYVQIGGGIEVQIAKADGKILGLFAGQ